MEIHQTGREEEGSSLTRQRLSFMVSEELSKRVERIVQQESARAIQEGVGPPAKSRIIEKLLSMGVRAFEPKDEAKRNEGRDADHKD